ncbi:kinase-like domain-containing protein [Rhizophagus irregularis DAOM 181602=DAOM 197198]|nr:kinase-like domain-containing protein [Rhizophagus irregularis DAOM 181602=DAOM 197198]
MSSNNETQVVSDFNELNVSENSISVKTNHKNCYDPYNDKFWCKECVPRCIIEGWTSGNDDIDNLIKDSIYDTCRGEYIGNGKYSPSFLKWVPFDRFEDMKQIGEGGFAKVYSATWIDGDAKYIKQDDGNWIKEEPKSMKVALKRLNGSQNMSADYLNELKTHWKLNCAQLDSLKFYGMTKDPKTEEFIMIMQFASRGNLKNILSSNFKNILWDEKVMYLTGAAEELKNLHSLGYFHKDFHSGNMLSDIEEVKAVFGKADKEIQNISTLCEKDPDAIYTSRAFTFKNLSKPINSSFIATTYLDNKDCQDSQLIDLEVPSTSKLEDGDSDN